MEDECCVTKSVLYNTRSKWSWFENDHLQQNNNPLSFNQPSMMFKDTSQDREAQPSMSLNKIWLVGLV
ncbi:unnamed protein product, partial [Vitis vinifera]